MNCKDCKCQPCSLAGKDHEMSFECDRFVTRNHYDIVISQSIEDMALFIENCTKGFIQPTRCNKNCLREDCYDCWLEWLQMEVATDASK